MADIVGVDTSSYPKAQAPKSPLEVANQFMDFRQKQQNLMQSQMDMQRQRFQMLGDLTSSLLPLGDKITMDHVRDKVKIAVDMGLIDAKTGAGFLQNAQAQSGTGKGLFTFAQQIAQSTTGAAKAMEAQMGSLGMVDTGPGITQVRTPGMLGPSGKGLPAYPVSPTMAKDLTPGEAASGVEVVNPLTGQRERRPLGELTPETPQLNRPGGSGRVRNPLAGSDLEPQEGQPKLPPEPVNPLSRSGAAVGPKVRSETVDMREPQPRGQGMAPESGQGQTLGRPPGQANPNALPRGAAPRVTTSMTPDQEKEVAAQGDIAVGYKEAAQAAAQSQIGLDDLRKATEKFKTGGGAELRQTAAQVLQAVGMPKDLVDKVSNGSLPAGQVFDKQAMDVVTQTMSSRFGGKMPSNLEFGSFLSRFPNINTDPAAVRHMIDYFSMLNRMAQDRAKMYAMYKDQGKDVTKFPTQWAEYVSGPRSPYKMPGGE